MTGKNVDQWAQVTQTDLARIPSRIEQQVRRLNELDRKVKAATSRASTAADSAKQAAGTSRGGFLGMNNTAAVEALQKAGVDTAEALVSATEAQSVQFQLQTDLAEVTKGLFALGVTSLAMNRTTIQALELKMTGASKSKLTDLARREISNIIDQLRAQQDILLQQERQGVAIEALRVVVNEVEHAGRAATEAIGRINDAAATLVDTTKAEFERTDNTLTGLQDESRVLHTRVESTAKSVEVIRRDAARSIVDVLDRVSAGETESARRLAALEDEGGRHGALIQTNAESIEGLRRDVNQDVGDVRGRVTVAAESVATLRQDVTDAADELRDRMAVWETGSERRWAELEIRLAAQVRQVRLLFWTTGTALAVGAAGVVLAFIG